MTEDSTRAADESPTRVLALDYGQARIGVAISDELGLLAHPRPFVPAKPEAKALAELRRLVDVEGITTVVIGLPRNMDGSLGISARKAEAFAEKVAKVTARPIVFVDERLSTVQAHAMLRDNGRNAKQSKGLVDSASATILLQSYLDGIRRP